MTRSPPRGAARLRAARRAARPQARPIRGSPNRLSPRQHAALTRRAAQVNAEVIKGVLPLAVVHTLGNLLTNVSLGAVSVSFTHTIKARAASFPPHSRAFTR